MHGLDPGDRDGVTLLDQPGVQVLGRRVTGWEPHRVSGLGLAFIPERRKISPNLSVADNLTSSSMPIVVRRSWQENVTSTWIERLGIRSGGPFDRTEHLSGGNQQKVALARWLAIHPRVMILDEPTQGVDIGSKSEIHQLIVQLAEQGMAIILISSELPEILGMSHRVMVMHEGRVTGVLPRTEADQLKIMDLAAQ